MEQSESKTIISAQSKTNKTVSEAEEKKIVAQMSTVGIAGNVLLSAFKLIAGLAGSSGAMISDAVHSLSDVLATFIAMIGVRISKRGADADHQYGHEKFECISSEILAGILFVTGLGIGSVGVEKIIGGHYEDLTVPGMLPLIAAIVSIVSKEAMFWYTRACAKKIQSSAFMADAMASPLRCIFFHRFADWYCRCAGWFSGTRSDRERGHLSLYFEGGS